MRDYFKAKTWVITTLMFVMAFGLSLAIVYYELGSRENVKIISAGSGDNVSGWAWNLNIGWISFNCTNENPQCSGADYGVSVDPNTGDFSGYAWNSNIGWIDFAPAGPYPEAPLNPAYYDSATGDIAGWAKIISMGADGWLKMIGDIDSEIGDFSGWAWNANDDESGIGWVSFNCSNDSSCGVANYKVTVAGDINSQPQAAALTAPNWNYAQARVNVLGAKPQFDFIDPDAGSYGSAYQLVVKKADDSPVLDTDKCIGYNTLEDEILSADCKIDNNICMRNGSAGCLNAGDCVCSYALDESKLAYNTSYKWWIQVWDNYGVPSALTSYDTSPDTDNDDGSVYTFTTYKHKFPKVNTVSTTYFPANPNRGEEVKFTDNSKTYETAFPVTEKPCDPAICSWLWTAPGGATINDPATSTPIIIFNNSGPNNVILRVTDLIDGYYSEITIPVNINTQLPKWKEIKPE